MLLVLTFLVQCECFLKFQQFDSLLWVFKPLNIFKPVIIIF